MTKSFIIVLLIVSMLLQGCTSYALLTERDKSEKRPKEGEPVNFVLRDGSHIESAAYHHIYVSEPEDCIYGIGEQFKKPGRYIQRGNPFQGKIRRSLIDSTTTERVGRNSYLVCWLSDSSSIRFSESDYINITPDQGAGFWCVGNLKDSGKMEKRKSRSMDAYKNEIVHTTTPFKGKVPADKLTALEIRKSDATRTIFLILGIALPPTILLILIGNGLSKI